VFSDPEGAGRDAQPLGQSRAVSFLIVHLPQQLSILLIQLCHRRPHGRPAFTANQGCERMRLVLGRVFAGEPEERSSFPTARPKVLQANVLGCLKYEGRQGGRVLHSSGTAGFDHPSQSLLGHILCGSGIMEPAEGKQAEPLPKATDEGRLLRGARESVRRQVRCRNWIVPVTLTFHR